MVLLTKNLGGCTLSLAQDSYHYYIKFYNKYEYLLRIPYSTYELAEKAFNLAEHLFHHHDLLEDTEVAEVIEIHLRELVA